MFLIAGWSVVAAYIPTPKKLQHCWIDSLECLLERKFN